MIAVIPARGGSKRIPRKNIREFGGRTMLGWPVRAALNCSQIDKVYVSTDDDEIETIAKKEGATVFRRPTELADDFVGLVPVIENFTHAMKVEDETWVVCVFATTPFLTSKILNEAATAAHQFATDQDFLISVCEFRSPPERALTLDDKQRISMRFPEQADIRTQDCAPAFHDAAQFLFGRARSWRNRDSVWRANSVGYPLPPEVAVDIDTEADWQFAERLYHSTVSRTTQASADTA